MEKERSKVVSFHVLLDTWVHLLFRATFYILIQFDYLCTLLISYYGIGIPWWDITLLCILYPLYVWFMSGVDQDSGVIIYSLLEHVPMLEPIFTPHIVWCHLGEFSNILQLHGTYVSDIIYVWFRWIRDYLWMHMFSLKLPLWEYYLAVAAVRCLLTGSTCRIGVWCL